VGAWQQQVQAWQLRCGTYVNLPFCPFVSHRYAGHMVSNSPFAVRITVHFAMRPAKTLHQQQQQQQSLEADNNSSSSGNTIPNSNMQHTQPQTTTFSSLSVWFLSVLGKSAMAPPQCHPPLLAP